MTKISSRHVGIIPGFFDIEVTSVRIIASKVRFNRSNLRSDVAGFMTATGIIVKIISFFKEFYIDIYFSFTMDSVECSNEDRGEDRRDDGAEVGERELKGGGEGE